MSKLITFRRNKVVLGLVQIDSLVLQFAKTYFNLQWLFVWLQRPVAMLKPAARP
jgi:hypothetical protein